ncbi:prepilin-type N-terminal cleavage/methylation domain-containing protein [Hyphobacterium sp.]|uniref:type IV pilus modification PilV family protein n=1 Tax=Hyphobacterium sp. TaxID=2004662 RepID=UPI00374A2637
MTSSKSGFTLLETVIAIALASAGLAAVYQVYASSARAEQAADETETAARIAEFLLLTADAEASGETDGFAWSIQRSENAEWEGLETLILRLTSPSGREFELMLDRQDQAETPG